MDGWMDGQRSETETAENKCVWRGSNNLSSNNSLPPVLKMTTFPLVTLHCSVNRNLYRYTAHYSLGSSNYQARISYLKTGHWYYTNNAGQSEVICSRQSITTSNRQEEKQNPTFEHRILSRSLKSEIFP